MNTVVNDPTNPRYAPLIKAAFGNDPDMAHVKAVVGAMRGGSVLVDPVAQTYSDPSQHAHTQWNKAGGELRPTNIKFGTNFYSKYFSTGLRL
jgi:hypothetical protein